jgi:CRP-like cAMP-binding protein
MTASNVQYNIKPFHKGQVIFREGQKANTAYLVKSGAVIIQKMMESKQVTLARIKSGEIFGEMGIISGEPRYASAIAEDFCELIVISEDTLNRVLLESPKIVQAITKVLIERLRATTQKISGGGAANTFIGACNVIDFMFSTHCEMTPAGTPLGIPYAAARTKIKEIIGLSQLEIDTFVNKLQSANIVQMIDKRVVSGNVPGRSDKDGAQTDVQRYLAPTDPKTFLKTAARFYAEFKETISIETTGNEFIDIHDFAGLVDSTPEMIYRKIAAGEVPENLFFIHRPAAAEWFSQVGVMFFKKVKRRMLNIEDLTDVDDIVFVDDTTLQDALSNLGPYKVCILVSIAGDEARSKIYASLSKKMADVVKDQIAHGQTVDEIEAGDIERELIRTIKTLKGVTA